MYIIYIGGLQLKYYYCSVSEATGDVIVRRINKFKCFE